MNMLDFINQFSDSEERYELVRGEPIKMMSASMFHEWIVAKIISQFTNYLDDNPCEVFGSNLLVKISEDTFRMPDISIICDMCNLSNKASLYEGVPELVVEVTSASNTNEHMKELKENYVSIGVKEYWVIYNEYNVEVTILKDNKYISIFFASSEDDVLSIPVNLKGWDLIVKIDLNKIPPQLRTSVLHKLNDSDIQMIKDNDLWV